MKPAKLFTVEEANAQVPRLGHLLERLQRTALRLDAEKRALQTSGGATPTMEELLRRRPAARALVEELDAVVQEIQQTGAQLKDIELGLVDFPARIEDEIVCLCWQFGEPEVAFWHREAEGFGGRRPLPGTAPPRWLQ